MCIRDSASTIEQLRSENPEIEIEETDEKIKIPIKALKFLATILRALSEGRPVSIVAVSYTHLDVYKRQADVYAQTIAYGMFAARLHDPG